METHQPASTAPSPHLASLQVDAGGKERCMGAFLGDLSFHCQRKGHKSPGVLSESGKSIRHIVVDIIVSPFYYRLANIAFEQNIFTQPESIY